VGFEGAELALAIAIQLLLAPGYDRRIGNAWRPATISDDWCDLRPLKCISHRTTIWPDWAGKIASLISAADQ
jgi:hypothetical protein